MVSLVLAVGLIMMLASTKVVMIEMGMLMKIVVTVIVTMVMIMVVSGIVGVNVCIDNDVGNIEGIDDGNGNVDEDSCDGDYDGGDYGRQRYR